MNLGNALDRLGETVKRSVFLEQAVDAYKAALEAGTRERVPLQWAMTQNNLGTALMVLGQLDSGTERLEKAVVAYRAALQERTRDRVPLQWAKSTGNHGIAMMLLAERLRDATMAQTAVEDIEAAYLTMRDAGDAPDAEELASVLRRARNLSHQLRSRAS
jgi:tetratricopeptide (TPR) repeat protein